MQDPNDVGQRDEAEIERWRNMTIQERVQAFIEMNANAEPMDKETEERYWAEHDAAHYELQAKLARVAAYEAKQREQH